MRKGLTILAVLMLVATACRQAPAPFWFEGITFEAAREQARAEGKMILIDFYAPS